MLVLVCIREKNSIVLTITFFLGRVIELCWKTARPVSCRSIFQILDYI